ncbi:MAG TPA: retroviral-like aspartic protease family protein [Bacteroidota bacterium]|nr:retroviral-like aspartic protease family protein [Bacteroidota bacterium]
MGLTFVEGVVQGPTGKKRSAQFLVDSGATYTLLSRNHWKAIELTPKRELNFTLADGTVVKRSMSECVISLTQGEAHTPVILGEEGDESLLGSVTLEILGLMLNPFHRTLEPMKMMLA